MTSEKAKPYLPLSDTSAFDRRLKSRRRIIKSFQAQANARRTWVDTLADWMTKRFGSMEFLLLNVTFFIFWLLMNARIIPILEPFDPFPFGMLTTIVSLEAIILAITVLISQNRAARVDDLREEVDLHINTIAEEEITKIMELQVKLLEKHGIDISQDPELQLMLEPLDTKRIEKVLEKEFK